MTEPALDPDACTTYRIRPRIYLFAWREKVVPCAAVTVAHHAPPFVTKSTRKQGSEDSISGSTSGPISNRLRSHGVLFGLDDSAERTEHCTFGAYGRLLGTVAYPHGYDPPTR